jgi:hypothetical protein
LPVVAQAEVHPLLAPTRDVTVEYEVAPPGRVPVGVRVAIQAGGARLRITSPELPTTFLVDRPAGEATVLLPMLRAYSAVKIGKYDIERTVLRGAHFSRAGHSRVAGHDCAVWHAESPQGTADACITDDGIIMRGSASSSRKGEAGQITALRVIYGALPAEDFVVRPISSRVHSISTNSASSATTNEISCRSAAVDIARGLRRCATGGAAAARCRRDLQSAGGRRQRHGDPAAAALFRGAASATRGFAHQR